MTDLEKLIPQDTLVQVAGETIAISPLKVGQLPAFLRVISPVMAHLSQPQINWLALFGERGDDLLNAIGIAVKKPREWVDDLAADDALLLAAKVMEVNGVVGGHYFKTLVCGDKPDPTRTEMADAFFNKGFFEFVEAVEFCIDSGQHRIVGLPVIVRR